MKKLTFLAAAMMIGTASSAMALSLNHQQDGYRDTGCDPAAFTDILTADGRVAYRNNPTCPGVAGNSGFDLSGLAAPAPGDDDEEVDPEEPTDPVDPEEPTDPVDPTPPSCKGKCGPVKPPKK